MAADDRRSPRSHLEALRASETRYRRLFETAQDGILILNAETGRVLDANPYMTKLLGYTREELLGKQLWELGAFEDIGLAQRTFDILQMHGYVRYEDLPLIAKDGRKREVEFVSNSYRGNGDFVIQCNIRDISSRHQREAELILAAHTDFLTGVANRRHFIALGRIEHDRSVRYQHELSVLAIDLDRFKQVNDVHGHAVGDRVLKAFAEACLKQLREVDLIGRMGGEEFSVMLPETGNSQAVDVAGRLRSTVAAMRVPADNGASVRITISIGVATLGSDDQSLEALLKRADTKLYEAKAGGRDRVVF